MNDESYVFEKLTPVDNANIKVYESAINYVFQNDDIKNVAISGAYGAGKSSLIASYKKAYPKHKLIHISLAHFKSSSENHYQTENNGNVDITDLEGKILNQLIHQIPPQKIQQTHFKIKRTIKTRSIILQTVAIAVFILALLHVILWSDWRSYVNLLGNSFFKTIVSFTTSRYSRFISGTITAALTTWFIYCLVKMQTNKNLFKKLNVQGNEIEIFENDDDSYFDKYLNEVLYLFENSDADAIVFEDMDRFESGSIFERLREINTLANIQLKNENKKPLRFFYLLRDDVFTSKDRTKFFDFIIPVVPVVDSSNSYNQFIDLLKKNKLFEKFDENFLQGLSLYIDDMRLLINICNEFLIYINRLNTTELNYNKMLALITYKNLFPRDFCELQLNGGFIYSLFSKKSEYIEQTKKELEQKISDKESEIEMATNETLESIQELKDIYEAKKNRTYNYYSSDRQEYIENLNKWHKNEYPKREQAIENKSNNKISDMKAELQELKSQLQHLNSCKLCETITRENIDKIFKSTTINEIGEEEKYLDIKASPYFLLLKYLVRNGFIDETYSDYMTYFYDNSLSRTDKIFLRSIADRKAREFTYRLDNPEMVVNRLKVADFDQEETLNFCLLNYLLKSKKESEMIAHFMCQLKKCKQFDFIGQYLEYIQEPSAFIGALYEQWIDVLEAVIKQKILTTDLTKQFVLFTLYYATDAIIERANINNCLTDYISNDEKFLNIEQPDILKLISVFKLINVSFRSVDYELSNIELFEAIYQNSLYELNYNNLNIMLRHICGIENENDIKHKNYTLIISIPESPLNRMVSENISEYFDVILDSCEKQIDDNSDTIIIMLNNSEITFEQKETYLEYSTKTIPLLSQITNDTLWSKIIDKRRLDFSERNIFEYFAKFKKIDQHLVDYINNHNNIDIDMSALSEKFEEVKSELFEAVIKCTAINDTSYAQILKSMNQCYNYFDIEDITEEKIQILINTNIIQMNVETLKFMRENYSHEILIYYIQYHIEEYTDIINSKLFSQEELISLLSSNISDELKLKLLAFSNKPITIIKINYSITIKLHILKNNLQRNDMATLYNDFDSQPREIRDFITSYAEDNFPSILSNTNNVSSTLKETLLKSSLLLDKKVKLFMAMVENENIDFKKAIRILTTIGLTEYEKILLPRHKPKIQINGTNKLILDLFVKKEWIDSYEEDSIKNELYKIHKRSVPKKQE